MTLVYQSLSLAAGPGEGGGGDICEKKFNSVRNEIYSWIHRGGYLYLDLPDQIQFKNYKTQMLEKISLAKVSCNDEAIGENDPPCHTLTNARGASRIICNSKMFLDTDSVEQFVQVHHQYASLAELEPTTGDKDLQNKISNQLRRFTVTEMITKLVIKPIKDGGIQKPVPPYVADNDKNLCKDGLCRLISLQLDNQCKIKSVILNSKVYYFVESYLKEAEKNKNPKKGITPEYPVFTPAEETALSFQKSINEVVGKIYGIGNCDLDSGSEFVESKDYPLFDKVTITLKPRSLDRIVSLYIDKFVYDTITLYFNQLVNTNPGEPKTYPAFTPAEQTMILFYVSILEGMQKGQIKTTLLDKTQYEVTETYISHLISKKPGEDPTLPQFTPAEQTIFLYVTTLLMY